MKKFYFLIAFLACLFSSDVIAQTDTMFWFAPPDVSNLHQHSDDYIEIRLASVSNVPVTVKLSQPANPNSPVNSLSTVINPGSSYTFNLSTQLGIAYKDVLETTDGGIKNSGLLITSTGPITAYYEVGRATSIPNNKIDTADYNGEIFSLKGNNALGTHFFTPFQTYFPNLTSLGGNSSIDMVAIQDNTVITFKLTKQGRNGTTYYNQGQNYTITLNKGQAYSIIATGTDGPGHMSGSEITSTKPIAVTQKDDSVNPWWDNYAADILGDQLVPVPIVGTEYIVVRGFLQQRNSVFIVATQPNTNVTVHANSIIAAQTQNIVNAGDLWVHDLDNTNPGTLYAEQITSDKPIYVYYVSGYVSEFGGPLLPPINCTGSQELSFVRSSADPFFLTVLVRTEGIGNFLVQGQPGVINANDFITVGSGWSAAQKRMDGIALPAGIPVNQGIFVENTTSYFHLGIINGQVNKTARFGYFSNYNKIVSQLPTIQALCPQSTVLLDPKVLGADSANTRWYLLPNNTTPVHVGPVYNATASGQYRLDLNDKNQCNFIDTVTVKLTSLAPFDLGKSADTVCYNVSNPIKVLGQWSSILWTKVPQGINVPANTTSLQPTKSGLYQVTVQDNSGCTQKDSVQVAYSDSTASFNLGPPNATNCFNATNPILVKGGPYQQVLWSGPVSVPDGTLSFDPKASGTYTVMVKDNYGCSNSDKVTVYFDTTLAKFDLGNPTRNICADGAPIVVKGGPYASIVWNGPASVTIPQNTTSYKPTVDGVYKVTVTDTAHCSASDQVAVTYIDSIKVNLGGDSSTSCGTHRTVLTPSNGNYGYTWSNTAGVNIPDGTASYTPEKTGLYKVKVYNITYPQCYGQDSIFVVFSPDIDLDFKGDSAVSCFNAGFKLCAGTGYASYVWSPAAIVPAGTKECYAPTASGKYYLTITDKYKCQKSDSIFVKYYGKIDIGLNGNDTATCYPYTSYVIRLSAGYAKYEWTPAVSADSLYTPIYTNALSEKFKVKVKNKDGCSDTDSVQVSFVPEIKFPFIPGGDTVACSYAHYTIHAGSGFAKYVWSNNVAGIHDSTFVPLTTGDYSVTVYTQRGGCKSTSALTHVTFAPERTIDLGSPITHCKNSPPDTLHAGIGFDSYLWENNPLYNKESFVPPFPAIQKGGVTDTISLKAVYQKICVAKAEKVISFIKNDTLDIGPLDTTVCPGQPVTMSAGDGFISYSWISSDKPDSIISDQSIVTVTRPATYTLYVTSNCLTAPAFKNIKNFPNPDATIHYELSRDNYKDPYGGDTVYFCYTEKVNLRVKSGYKKYLWEELTSGSTYNADSTLGININGIYQVKVIDTNNCYSTGQVVALTNDSCFKIPNLMTPNNDHKNDAFNIAGIQDGIWDVEIYNRWGERVFYRKGYSNQEPWNADNVSDGIYYYYMENPNNDKKYKGWLQVIDKQ